MKLKGRCINPGNVEGRALVMPFPFSFVGEFDPETGKIISTHPEFAGQSLKDKILVCLTGKGSSMGPGTAYLARKYNNAPMGLIVAEIEPVLACAALVADIPTIDRLNEDPLSIIATGDYLRLNADEGLVEVLKKSDS